MQGFGGADRCRGQFLKSDFALLVHDGHARGAFGWIELIEETFSIHKRRQDYSCLLQDRRANRMCQRLKENIMRKRTLAAVCSMLSVAILFALSFSGIPVPLRLLPFIVFLVLLHVLIVPLTLVNKR